VTFAGLIATDYGKVLVLKLLLFIALLGVAAANR
jgi:putative copper export protein